MADEVQVRRVAALDLGTNSLRALVADCASDGTFRIIADEKFACRIGEGLALTGELGEEAIARTLDGLRRALGVAQGHGVERIDAVATSAVREADNGAAFLARVRAELGLQLRIVTGAEEARLAYLSLQRHFDVAQRPTVALDLGGGSLEVLVAAREELVEDICTLPLGAVRLTEIFLPDAAIAARQYRRLRRHVQGVLARHLGDYAGQGHQVYGSGGAITSIARIVLARRGRPESEVMGLQIKRPVLRQVREVLRSLPLEERRRVAGLSPARADIIVAAAVVLEETLRALDAEAITVNAQGIREGILVRMSQGLFPRERREVSPETSRETSVRAFARTCGYEEAHAEHVQRLALSLLEQLGPREGVDADEARMLLGASGLLHDVGHLVHFNGHPLHSYHLIAHAELAGFTPRRLRLVALIARFHTGKRPRRGHRALADLDKGDRRLVRYLAGVLRVADGLDRCHCQRIREVTARLADGELALTVEAESNPELELWAAKRKGDLLERVLAAALSIAEARPRA